MLLPGLLLQKISKKCKAKDHRLKLEERLGIWKNGDIDKLLSEGRIIQQRIEKQIYDKKKDNARTFSNLMLQGKVTSAIRFLSSCDAVNGGLAKLDEYTMAELKKSTQMQGKYMKVIF